MKRLLFLACLMLLLTGCALTKVVNDDDLSVKYRGVIQDSINQKKSEKTKIYKDKLNDNYKVVGDSYNLELRGILIGDFVDMLFSKVLNMPYVIDHQVKNSSRGVDISIRKKINKSQLYQIAVKALERVGYWVEVDNGTVFIYNRDEVEKKSGRVVYSVVLSHVASYEIIDSLRSHIGGDDDVKVSGDDRRCVVISGEYYAARRLSEIAVLLDQEQKRVRVEVEIYEMNITGALKIGFEGLVNKSIGDLALNIASPIIDIASIYSASLTYSNTLKTLISLMKKDDVLKSVAKPFLYCTDSKVCSFDVGQKIPVLQASKTSNEGASTVNQLIYYDTGVKVSLSPVVISNDDIMIDLTVETSKGSPNNLSSLESPIIINRKLKTEIRARSRIPLVIAGIIYNQSESILSGIPVENKWLEYLKNRTRDEVKTELIIIMTPYIVEDQEIDEVNKRLLQLAKGLK